MSGLHFNSGEIIEAFECRLGLDNICVEDISPINEVVRVKRANDLKRNPKYNKMMILQRYKFLEKLVGLNPSGGVENIVLRVIYIVTLLSFQLMELIYVIVNIRYGIDKAASAMAPLTGVFPAPANYIYLVFSRAHYYSLLKELQGIVNESM